MRRGSLIVFTGIDGSGKTTQAKLLVDSLNQDSLCVSYVWNRWEPLFLWPLIKRWKHNVTKRTTDNELADNELVELNSDFNRIKHKKQKLLDNPVFRWLWLIYFFIDYGLQVFVKVRLRLLKKCLVISDRTFYDSVIDQAVNLGKNRDWLLNSLDSFWMKFFFPKPDMVIYIDCPEKIAFSRKRDERTPNIEYLIERRKLYLALADKYNWVKLNGILPIDEIAVQVKEKVYKKLDI